ncbi:MAG: phosphate acyltransferase PlsX [Lachnospiraceae bacterium]|nr:phosphate acyltransferase PlsX [Lachnospiraceae bacterium]
MSEKIRVVLDAMGGDFAPAEPVKAAVEALNENTELFIYLTGKEDQINQELQKYTYPKDRLEVVHASEIIETGEAPAKAIQTKKDSSLVKGLKMVREGKADAIVSAGSTGAVLVGGQVIVRKVPGVERAPLAPLIPTEKGFSLLIDCGANVDARSSHLVQFAIIGTIYMKHVIGIENPTVGLVNIGAEEEKGNALAKETYQLLKETEGINFIGNVEARDIPAGAADIVVTEAFTGNVILKLYEGLAGTLIKKVKEGLMSTLRSKIGGILIKPALKNTLKSFDSSTYGGAPLLGLRGLVVKTHGSAKSVEIKNSIIQCIKFTEQDLPGMISEHLKK